VSTIPKERILLEEEIPGGAMWSHVLRRHQTLRLTDLEGGGNASVLLYNRELLTERYNMPDTLKSQHTAFLTKGVVLCSDMGRILCSITEDSCGWHDTITGVSDLDTVKAKYGAKTYQEARNEYHRNGRDCLLNELSKWGLGARDLVPNANFFTKVTADAEGKLSYVAGHSKAGSFVDLRAEMNVLVVLTTCQHAFDPSTAYAPKKVGVTVWKSDPPAADDLCRLSRPENARGFTNTERMFLGA
jgi:urea carboxylase-associated protein 2